jgi:outer membrane lipoprotein SlyB
MKKLFAIILTLTLLSVAAIPSFAQGRDRRTNRSQNYYGSAARSGRAYDSRSYYDYRNRDRSFWDKHRDKLTVAGGAGGGALLGAIIGGKKGAAIGALAGAGGSALYTYKIRNRNRYRRY